VTRKIGIAVIGLGPAALPHSRSLVDLGERVDVRHVVSRSQERLDAYRAQFPFPGTTDIDAALADQSVEAVIVLTPPSSHRDVGARCLAADKHVLVEKPLELTAARGEELVAAARRSGKAFGVVLQHRFRPASLRLKAALDGGELGAVEAGLLQVPWWRPQSYYDEPGRGTMGARRAAASLLTQAIHSFDLFRSLVGVSRVVAAQVRTTSLHKMETEDYVGALLETGNGAPATLGDHHRRPSRPSRADRDHRQQGPCGAGRRAFAALPSSTAARKWSRPRATPAAAPTSWTSRTTPTAP
jgi:predicted dehydrogenase